MTSINQSNDPLGQALIDYCGGVRGEDIIVLSPDFDDDVIPVDYLFREYEKMPSLEQKALHLANGKILDVGAGSGSHSLFLQEKGMEVCALDSSPGAFYTMTQRGIKCVIQENIYELKKNTYDTILLLMNGIGLAGSPAGYKNLLTHLKNLLRMDGQILFDSSDIRYLYDKSIPSWQRHPDDDYYGIVSFRMKYKNHLSPEFNWLYIDHHMAKKLASDVGFIMEILQKDEHYGYLARLIKK